jgi:hypothetical protein
VHRLLGEQREHGGTDVTAVAASASTTFGSAEARPAEAVAATRAAPASIEAASAVPMFVSLAVPARFVDPGAARIVSVVLHVNLLWYEVSKRSSALAIYR